MELAARGHEVHFITYANPDPPGSGYAAHPLSRSGSLQLPAVSIPAVLPGAGRAHGGSGGELPPRPAARALRDSAFDRRDAGAADAGERAPPALHHHAARHRHHAGGRGPFVFRDHQVLHREIGRHHVDQRLSARADGGDLRRAERDPRDQELRQLRSVPSGQREEGRRGVRAGRREAADSPVEFPAREARAGLHPHSGGGAQERAGAPADGGRRSRARSGGAPGAQPEGGPARDRFWASRITWSG